jgi:type VI secretion system protein ImpF
MAEANRDRINPSLLDRLTDEAPGESVQRGGSVSLSELRKSVLRDLNWLFNSTQMLRAEEAESWPLVKKSVLNYGLPPLAGLVASGIDVRKLERTLRQAILDFECR